MEENGQTPKIISVVSNSDDASVNNLTKTKLMNLQSSLLNSSALHLLEPPSMGVTTGELQMTLFLNLSKSGERSECSARDS